MENSQKSKIIKPRTQWDDISDYISNSGNGYAVPQFKLDAIYGRRQGVIVPLLDKDGKQVVKNLYQEIQNAGADCEIQKLLKKSEICSPTFTDDFVNFDDLGSDISNLDPDMDCFDANNVILDIKRKQKASSLKEALNKTKEDYSNYINAYKKRLSDIKKVKENDENKQDKDIKK